MSPSLLYHLKVQRLCSSSPGIGPSTKCRRRRRLVDPHWFFSSRVALPRRERPRLPAGPRALRGSGGGSARTTRVFVERRFTWIMRVVGICRDA